MFTAPLRMSDGARTSAMAGRHGDSCGRPNCRRATVSAPPWTVSASGVSSAGAERVEQRGGLSADAASLLP
jgi:hypothetical protein